MTDTNIDRSIKIEGTDYDRRRKLTLDDVSMIKKLHAKGCSISSLADIFKVSRTSIIYHTDDSYKEHVNKTRKNYVVVQHPKEQFDSRVAYKKTILNGSI